MLRNLLLVLGLLALFGSRADAQTCSGGTASAPACARNWAAGPLVVTACTPTSSLEAGVKLHLRELNSTPILSVNPATPGGQVTLPTSSAPLAPSNAPTRRVRFVCEDPSGRTGVDTFVDLTFPVLGPPAAPVVQ